MITSSVRETNDKRISTGYVSVRMSMISAIIHLFIATDRPSAFDVVMPDP